MSLSQQAGWFFSILLAIACCRGYFTSTHKTPSLDEGTLATTADSIVYNLRIRQFNDSGALINYLESSEMHHIPHNDTARFSKPYIVISEPGKPDWTIRALSAISINKGEQITLIDKVRMHQNAGVHSPESSFETEKLDYFPSKKQASTTLPITYKQPGATIHAVGMEAYLDSKRVVLLSKIRALYDPKKS